MHIKSAPFNDATELAIAEAKYRCVRPVTTGVTKFNDRDATQNIFGTEDDSNNNNKINNNRLSFL
jgi:hypothetical protein